MLVWLSRFKFIGGSEALEWWLSSIRIFRLEQKKKIIGKMGTKSYKTGKAIRKIEKWVEKLVTLLYNKTMKNQVG